MRRLITIALVLMLAVSAAGMTACSSKTKDSGLGPVPPSAEETASVGATETTTPDDGATSATEPQTPPDTKELTDIQAELSAIEKELGSMDMPSDSDFGDIESSLK